jgi:hypothetical protein
VSWVNIALPARLLVFPALVVVNIALRGRLPKDYAQRVHTAQIQVQGLPVRLVNIALPVQRLVLLALLLVNTVLLGHLQKLHVLRVSIAPLALLQPTRVLLGITVPPQARCRSVVLPLIIVQPVLLLRYGALWVGTGVAHVMDVLLVPIAPHRRQQQPVLWVSIVHHKHMDQGRVLRALIARPLPPVPPAQRGNTVQQARLQPVSVLPALTAHHPPPCPRVRRANTVQQALR